MPPINSFDSHEVDRPWLVSDEEDSDWENGTGRSGSKRRQNITLNTKTVGVSSSSRLSYQRHQEQLEATVPRYPETREFSSASMGRVPPAVSSNNESIPGHEVDQMIATSPTPDVNSGLSRSSPPSTSPPVTYSPREERLQTSDPAVRRTVSPTTPRQPTEVDSISLHQNAPHRSTPRGRESPTPANVVSPDSYSPSPGAYSPAEDPESRPLTPLDLRPLKINAAATADSMRIPKQFAQTIVAAFGEDADLYNDVLQVSMNSGYREVRIAYFRRGREVLAAEQQDRGGDPNNVDMSIVSESAKLKFQAVSMAYEILSNEKWRSQYNDHGLWDQPEEAADEEEKTTVVPLPSDLVSSFRKPSSPTASDQTKIPSPTQPVLRKSASPNEAAEGPKTRNAVRWNEEVEELVFDNQDDFEYDVWDKDDDDDDDSFHDDDMREHGRRKKGRRKDKRKQRVVLEMGGEQGAEQLERHLEKLDAQAEKHFVSDFLDDIESSLEELLSMGSMRAQEEKKDDSNENPLNNTDDAIHVIEEGDEEDGEDEEVEDDDEDDEDEEEEEREQQPRHDRLNLTPTGMPVISETSVASTQVSEPKSILRESRNRSPAPTPREQTDVPPLSSDISFDSRFMEDIDAVFPVESSKDNGAPAAKAESNLSTDKVREEVNRAVQHALNQERDRDNITVPLEIRPKRRSRNGNKASSDKGKKDGKKGNKKSKSAAQDAPETSPSPKKGRKNKDGKKKKKKKKMEFETPDDIVVEKHIRAELNDDGDQTYVTADDSISTISASVVDKRASWVVIPPSRKVVPLGREEKSASTMQGSRSMDTENRNKGGTVETLGTPVSLERTDSIVSGATRDTEKSKSEETLLSIDYGNGGCGDVCSPTTSRRKVSRRRESGNTAGGRGQEDDEARSSPERNKTSTDLDTGAEDFTIHLLSYLGNVANDLVALGSNLANGNLKDSANAILDSIMVTEDDLDSMMGIMRTEMDNIHTEFGHEEEEKGGLRSLSSVTEDSAIAIGGKNKPSV